MRASEDRLRNWTMALMVLVQENRCCGVHSTNPPGMLSIWTEGRSGWIYANLQRWFLNLKTLIIATIVPL
jgi:hypothetical protein